MAKSETILQRFLILILKIYRYGISAFLGHCCRFYPSCSCYAEVAIERFGLLRGGFLALRRLGRCHPWCPGGYDPVPEKVIAKM